MEIQVNELNANLNTQVVTKKVRKQNVAKLQRSNFLITVNTNKRYDSLPQEESAVIFGKLKEAVLEFVKKITDFVIFEASKTGVEFGYSMEATKQELMTRVEKATLDYSFELGDNSTIHSHILFCMAKRALNNKIDLAETRKFFTEHTGFNCYINVRTFYDSKSSMQDYVSKQINNNK
jgi:hypothetical protein